MTHDDVRAWLNAYVEAWRTYDPAAIGALFTEDATYAYHPWNGEDDLSGAATPSSPTGSRNRTSPDHGRRNTDL